MIKVPRSFFLDDHRSKTLQNPEHYQNVIICFLANYQHFLKMSLEYLRIISSYFTIIQNKQVRVIILPPALAEAIKLAKKFKDVCL